MGTGIGLTLAPRKLTKPNKLKKVHCQPHLLLLRDHCLSLLATSRWLSPIVLCSYEVVSSFTHSTLATSLGLFAERMGYWNQSIHHPWSSKGTMAHPGVAATCSRKPCRCLEACRVGTCPTTTSLTFGRVKATLRRRGSRKGLLIRLRAAGDTHGLAGVRWRVKIWTDEGSPVGWHCR